MYGEPEVGRRSVPCVPGLQKWTWGPPCGSSGSCGGRGGGSGAGSAQPGAGGVRHLVPKSRKFHLLSGHLTYIAIRICSKINHNVSKNFKSSINGQLVRYVKLLQGVIVSYLSSPCGRRHLLHLEARAQCWSFFNRFMKGIHFDQVS